MPYSYLALGDSYTIGEQVALAENFPNQTVKILSKEYNIDFDTTKIIAVTGWTTDELKAGIAAENIQETYDWVTLLIGVNNQYRDRSIENYAEEFEDLWQEALRFASGKSQRVVVLSIPDYGVTPFAKEKNPEKIAQEIAAFNKINKSISRKYGALYLDITPSTILHGAYEEYLVEDKLHYSAKEYHIWAKHLAELIKIQLDNENK